MKTLFKSFAFAALLVIGIDASAKTKDFTDSDLTGVWVCSGTDNSSGMSVDISYSFEFRADGSYRQVCAGSMSSGAGNMCYAYSITVDGVYAIVAKSLVLKADPSSLVFEEKENTLSGAMGIMARSLSEALRADMIFKAERYRIKSVDKKQLVLVNRSSDDDFQKEVYLRVEADSSQK